ncbi:MAG: hypothetical protein JWN94_629 [Betaproteobacteria bacterium]|nr:hypothetical protein [Betaproteobacteria bacterium]
MQKCAVFAVVALLVPMATGAYAQDQKPADVWFSGGHVSLSATAADGSFRAKWEFDRATNGDIRLVKDESRGTLKVSGTLMSVCDDQALLFKDIAPAPRREMYELNEPILYLQLALRLLSRAMPNGLPGAGSETAIDIGDEKNTLRLRKEFSVRKDIVAPWRARGTARRAGSEVRFDLNVTYLGDLPARKPVELKLSGVWDQQSQMPALANDLNLSGWRVHRVDTVAEVVGGNTVVDSAARTTAQNFATLGEVRAAIGRWWDPNVKAVKQTECKL